MTEDKDTIQDMHNDSSKPTCQKNIITFKQKRVFVPLIGGAAALFLTAHAFVAFVAYILFGLAFDWIVFRSKGIKDSDFTPPHQLEKEQMTGEQYDNLNSFLVKVRQAATALGVSVAACCLLFFEDADFQFWFAATYFAVTRLAISLATKNNEIIYPHIESINNRSSIAFQWPTFVNGHEFFANPNNPKSPAAYGPGGRYYYRSDN